MYKQFNIQQFYVLSTQCIFVFYMDIRTNSDYSLYSFGWLVCIHSFISLSYDRSKASSKASSPYIAIQSFLFQMRVFSPFLKVIQ